MVRADGLSAAAVVLVAAAALLAGAACARLRPAVAPPRVAVGYEETGRASWYGHPYHGRRASSGEVYDMRQMTAAHRAFPFDTWVLVENLANGRTAEVRINDRGPFVDDRILDLSYAAARVLGAVDAGVIPVRLRVIAGPARRPASRAGAFVLQLGAFADETRAAALERELAGRRVTVRVRRAEIGDRVLYRVRSERFVSRAAADHYAGRLAALGYTVIVVEE